MSATATLPTIGEQEIRAAIEARLQAKAEEVFDSIDTLAGTITRLAIVAADPLIGSAMQTELMGSAFDGVPEGYEGGLWRDLRPSEAARLAELVHEAAERVQARCEPIVLAAMVAAGVTFAAEDPEAPISR